MPTPRQRFLDYVRRVTGARPIVSPFLPKPELVDKALRHLGLPAGEDPIANEVRLSRALDYEPMFMTDCPGLIFPWTEDPGRSDDEWVISVLQTLQGKWVRRVSRQVGQFGDDTGFPVQTEADHARLVSVCERIGERLPAIRRTFREWRERVGDDGVIVIGHPHVTWLAYQISQQNMVYHALDYPEAYQRSMDALLQAAFAVFGIALEEGIDFMSESSYGLEMISPAQFEAQDLPYTRALADWTHERGGLLWYHNCGRTRDLFRNGLLNRLGADVIETVAPPPEGDNDLAESRRWLDPTVCSKGNLSLLLLRDGSVANVEQATRDMVRATQGHAHIHSTADAVFAETPVENFVAFLRTAREEAERLASSPGSGGASQRWGE